MRYDFCTIFAINYLYKGIALYESLVLHCKNFSLWVLCIDDETYHILESLALKNVHLISHKDIETKNLLRVKEQRTVGEYCWTCKPPFILYLFKVFSEIRVLTYLDADMCIFHEPSSIYKMFSNFSIGITPQRLAPEYRNDTHGPGEYNAGFLMFRNNREALRCIRRWEKQCIEWCFSYYKDGNIGDQGYIDEWPREYKRVCIFTCNGVNAAPWNISQYKIKKVSDIVFLDDEKLIFYHFHSLKIYTPEHYLFSYYPLPKNAYRFIYTSYKMSLQKTIKMVKKVNPYFIKGFDQKPYIKERMKILTVKAIGKIRCILIKKGLKNTYKLYV